MKYGEVRENGAIFPHQRVVDIGDNSAVEPFTKEQFCPIRLGLMWAAAQDLSEDKSSFLLWLYFATLKKGLQWLMYQEHVSSTTGISKNSYKRAFKKLVAKGYLKEKENIKDSYIFDATAFGKIKPLDEYIIET